MLTLQVKKLKRTKVKYTIRRYILFVAALFIMSLGVAAITLSLLGTSPITSVNYVLSMFTPLSMGQWTIIVNFLLVLLQIPLITRQQFIEDKKVFLMQIPICLFFGLFIDASMSLLSWLSPQNYPLQLLCLLIGCLVLAIGVILEIKANIGMASGDYLIKVISRRFNFDYGYTKLGFDVTNVIIAIAFSLIFMSAINGLREGTVIAAIIVGPIIHFLDPYFRRLDKSLGYNLPTKADMPVQSNNPTIITISREYGSGASELGAILAKRLGIKLYDREFIKLAAHQSGMNKQYILDNEQTIPSFWMKCIFANSYGMRLENSLSPEDVLYIAQCKIVQQLAMQEPCIIIGRLADYILKDRPNVIRIFCYTDLEDAISRVVSQYGIPGDEAENKIKDINHKRISHYEYYTGQRWGNPFNYDLTINTGTVGLKYAADLIHTLYKGKN